ncbi:MAG TPA: hypothetical protein VHS96_09940 [Bacteroidia bacterium]|nr:hypothetical protein [Bacteroidia bacterium]
MAKQQNDSAFKISPDWDFVLSFKEIVDNARFCFIDGIQRKNRPMIVLKEKVEGVDCIELGSNRHGLVVKGVTVFDDSWGGAILDSSLDCVMLIRDYLVSINEQELILDHHA